MSVLSDSIEADLKPELKTGFANRPPSRPASVWGENNLPPALISDIDNTIAFLDPSDNARQPHDFSRSGEDLPNRKAMQVIKAWYSLTENPMIYFVTDRDVKWRDLTVIWLAKFFPPAQYKWMLRMRPSNDLISTAAAVKKSHLVNDIAKKFSVQQVLEDDDDCIAMYRSYGLVVLDAKEMWWPNDVR